MFLRQYLWIAVLAAAAPASPAAVPAEAAAPRFDVWEFRVTGNTVLPGIAIEKVVYPLLGPGKTIEDVNAARAAVEQAYRDAGFATVFVDVPEQDVDRGIVRLTVTEGRVGRVRVTGSRYFANGWIREQVPAVAPGTIPRIEAFQSQLKALNLRSPDRQLTPVLRPGAAPGTVDIELKVRDEFPLNGSLEVNNRNSASTTDTRLEAAVRYDNLWQRDHSFGLQYQVAPEDPDETRVIAGSYVLRPRASGAAFAFYGLSSDSDIAVVGGEISSIGKGRVYGARAIVPLAGDSIYHSLALGVDYKDFDETIGFNAEGEDDIVTPISYLNWSLGWNGSVPGDDRTQSFDVTANLGLRGVGNEAGEFADKRFKGRPNYVYLEAGYEVLQALPWWGTTLALELRGQVAWQPLISNEQFAAGGRDSVRGYYEGEALGDYGVQVSAEWRSPNIGPRLWKALTNLYGYGFLDGARLMLHDPLPSQADYTLLSAGAGLQLAADPLTAALDLAIPLHDGASTEKGDERLLFSVRYGF
ncbi:MAG: ShlB/FhaC/HecB family hemolysin secretion/activation protein [Gammaproteobacteria bacterium]|nr:ShlB/FhaC/HecB family hemolysin secretion/activation protein [Gammaproteobacteria bacterium]